MKRVTAMVCLLAVGVSLGCWANGVTTFREGLLAIAADPPYQRFASERQEAMFNNQSGQPAAGLKIVFSQPVPSVAGYGVGADITDVMHDAGVVVLSGAIPNNGTVDVTWIHESADVLAAEWLFDNAPPVPVNLNVPIARLRGMLVAKTAFFQLDLEFRMDGLRSWTRDGTRIAAYRWEWSDGHVQRGPSIVRAFDIRGVDEILALDGLTIVLTVENSAGETSTVLLELIRVTVS